MKRAFPQKVKSVSCHLASGDIAGEQPKQAPLGVHRKTRTSAAMIGLALSMGASSLLLPRQNDGATAAESISPESTFVTVPATPQAVMPSPISNVEEASTTASRDTVVIDHRVHAGQTLWQLARRYQVPVEDIAAATGIRPDTVLAVGQTVRIPVSRHAVSTLRPAAEATPRIRPVSSRPLDAASRSEGASERADELNSVVAALDSSEALLRTERNNSLSRLRQERDKLRNSLSTLRGSTDESPKPQATSTIPQTAQPERIALVDRPVVPQESVTAELESVIPQSAQSSEGFVHQVKPGETLGAIAQSYEVSQQALVEANQLSDPDWLRPNQALTIPQTQSTSQAPQTVAVVPNLGEPIASPSVPVAPSLQPTVIQPEITPPATLSYQVNPGDTIAQIAQTHQLSPSVLASANRLTNPDLIVVGQVIQIPAESSAPNATIPPTASISAPTLIATSPAQERQVTSADRVASVPAVTVPTVPTAAMPGAIALVPSPTPTENSTVLSTEFSGSNANSASQVATAPLSVVPSTVESSPSPSASGESNVFVQNLLSEIMTLRDRQRATTTGTIPTVQEPTVVAAVSSTLPSPLPASRSTVVNPEFNPQQYNQSVEAVSPGFERRQGERQQTPATSSRPQVVAVAPLGSESYDPLVRPITGRMVSPDLPPLPGADTFLPDGAEVFTGYVWPARGVFTSGYGRRWGRMHRGIDIAAPVGTPIYASAPGVVQFSGWNSGGYGNMVEVRHADGSMTRYAHNSRNLVRVGQRVEQGEQIAQMGSTGYSTGPHVHFEIHLPNQGTVNPIAYLPGR